MGSVKRNVGKKGFFIIILTLHPTNRCLKEQICTESLGFHDGLVVQKYIIKVLVFGIFFKVSKSILPNAPGPMHQDFMEASILR